jgi:uncharacterized protein YecE (DUF72 family)
LGFSKINIGTSGWELKHLTHMKKFKLRFHGPGELYASSYSDETLKTFGHKIKKWVKEKHVICIFFNNDIHGHAFRDAQTLKNILSLKNRAVLLTAL